jgi:tetratricopeptide (TPR) repeat protein
VALVVAVYWPAMGFGYVQFDDPEYINTMVRRGLTAEGIQWAFDLRGHVANWHPLTWLSLMLDTSLFGDNAAGHHAVNIAMHAANVVLFLGVLQAMTGMVWRSAIAAALLAVHPLNVESVAWVAERKDVLSLLFWLLAMRAYVSFARAPGALRYLLVTALLALGLMSKPMVVTLPLALLLMDFWPLQRIERAWRSPRPTWGVAVLVAEKTPMLVMSAIVARITVAVQHESGKVVEGRWMTLGERLDMALTGYARYLGKLLWPSDLAVLYPNLAPLGIDQWSTAQVAAACALISAISLAALVLIRRAPYMPVGWFWYLGTLIPVIGLVQVGRQSIADRYTYIPYLGLYVAATWLLGDLLSRWSARACQIGAAVAVVIVIALAVIAHRQVRVWRDSETLFAHALAVTDRNWLMLNNLGGVLAGKGDHDRAIPLLERATAICQECGWVHEHHGQTLLNAGRLREAQRALERAVELDPTNGEAHMNLGVAVVRQERFASALPHLRRAVELLPHSADARKNLAIGLSLAGRTQEAIEQMREAVRLSPDRADEFEAVIRAMTAGSAR